MFFESSICIWCSHFFFFFQAEDGIRDAPVTGVQTCALPIYPLVVPYEPQLRPGAPIPAEPLRHGSGEPSGRISLVVLEIPVGEIEDEVRREHRVVSGRHRGEEDARLVDVELVGIQPTPPISVRGDVPASPEEISSERVSE